MYQITQIRKLSLWIFLIPFVAINTCLFISQNYHLLENTIFIVDEIGKSGFAFPYIDGSLSISRASRTYPQYLIFKPAMILTAVLLFYYWSNNNNQRYNKSEIGLPGSKVEVRNNDITKAMRKFKRRIQEDGILQEYRERQYYEKPSLVRKKAKAAARSRWLKKLSKLNDN